MQKMLEAIEAGEASTIEDIVAAAIGETMGPAVDGAAIEAELASLRREASELVALSDADAEAGAALANGAAYAAWQAESDARDLKRAKLRAAWERLANWGTPPTPEHAALVRQAIATIRDRIERTCAPLPRPTEFTAEEWRNREGKRLFGRMKEIDGQRRMSRQKAAAGAAFLAAMRPVEATVEQGDKIPADR